MPANIEDTTESIKTPNIDDLYTQLNNTQRIYIDAYLSNGYNGYNAIMETELSEKITTRGSANVKSSVLLHSPEVKAYVAAYFISLRLEQSEELGKYIEELNKLAFIQEPETREDIQMKMKALELLNKVYYGSEKFGLLKDDDVKKITIEYV